MTNFFAPLDKEARAGQPGEPREPALLSRPPPPALTTPMTDAMFQRRIVANFCYFALILATILFVAEVIFAWSP